MTEEQFQCVSDLFEQALDHDPSGREQFLAETSSDGVVRSSVLSLLELDERLGDSFLNSLLDSMMTRTDTGRDNDGATNHVGTVLKDRYVLERELGAAMSVVYLASDLALPDKRWVVKILKLGAVNHLWFQHKFKEEIRTLTRLDHHAIVAVSDAGELAGNRPCFVMPYVDGVTLKSEIERGPLDAARVLHIVREVASALTYAHSKNVWHLDVKPSNVILQGSGGTNAHVWLIDFGIAMIQTPDSAGDADARAPAGTPGYMGPEQAEGRPCAASDVYALGVVTFEMLTGSRPHARDLGQLEALRTRKKGSKRPHAAPETRDSVVALPEATQLVIARALNRDPAQRPDPQAFAAALARSLSSIAGWQGALRAVGAYLQAAQRSRRAAIFTLLTLAVVLMGSRYLAPVNRAPVIGPEGAVSSSAALGLDSIDELREAYLSSHDQLRRNIQLQVMFVLLGAILIWRSGRRLTIPLLGVTFPTTWLCFVVPVILVILWLDFGFLLDDLIKWRAEAWRQMLAAGATARASGFNDSGFIDGWFMCFRPFEHTIRTDFLLGPIFFFCCTYCPLLAANHAFSVMLLSLGAKWSGADSTRRSRPERFVVACLPWLSAALILLSHVQFRLGGNNPNWMQWVVGGLSVTFAYLSWQHVSDVSRAAAPSSVLVGT